jgi:flagellar hook-length control protein FliK
MTPGTMPAGFATFLANIGQAPVDGGESSGFGQLLAAAPTVAAASPVPAASFKIGAELTTETGMPTVDVPVETGTAIDTPIAKPAPRDADADAAAAALAANLLIALNGAAPGNAMPAAKPVPTAIGAETETEAEAADIGETAATTPVVDAIAVVAAIVDAQKPAKPVETPTAPTDTDAPAAPVAARPRDAAPPLPLLAGTEAQAAKPVDAAPSMTVLFTQLQTEGAAALADPAKPALVAERVLDIDRDGAWIDQLAHDIAATKSDSGDISFRLMPRHLGRLDVAMRMDDEGMSLKMDTRHEATATIVTAAQGRLVEELRQQGVRVSGAEVTCTPGETGRQSQGQGRSATPDPAHLVETATERAEPRPKTDSEERAAGHRGRFA